MKKIFLYILILTFCMGSLYSQNQDVAFPHVIPMTPEAAASARYADYPVSHYTGVPNISVPLYEIDVDGFKLPITLSYHASGIRVGQEASWAGLGWNLNLGNRITRTIKDVDDFFEFGKDRYRPYTEVGYFYAPDVTYSLDAQYRRDGFPCCSPPHYTCIKSVLIHDSEPDIFYYDLPGMSGKFILDKSRGAVLFDKSHNLKIEVEKMAANSSEVVFVITDPDGNRYFYNDKEKTKHYSANTHLYRNTETATTKYDDRPQDFWEWSDFRLDACEVGMEPAPVDPYEGTSCWCLSKVITKTGREIRFSYENDYQELPTQESSEIYNTRNLAGDILSNNVFFYKSKVVNNAKRLSRIEGDFGRIDFTASIRDDMRKDITYNKYSKKLDQISVYAPSGSLIKYFKFEHGYFNDDYYGSAQYAHVFKRLKLNKVTEYSSTGVALNGGHRFQYYEGELPAKNSKNVDHWGFQNGEQYESNYCIGLFVNGKKLNGVTKNANFDKAVIGTLKEITYPSGGKAEFKYENNTFSGGYFIDELYLPPSVNDAHISVYNPDPTFPVDNNHGLPANYTHRFTVERKTRITIQCTVENELARYDPGYIYLDSRYNPLGQLRSISPQNIYVTYECPLVYEGKGMSGADGEGSEIRLEPRSFELNPGVYEFEAYQTPKAVFGLWTLNFEDISLDSPSAVSYQNQGGGIRIKEIKTDAKTRKFNYPLGKILVTPVLYYFGTRSGVGGFNENDCYVQVSESKTPLSTFNNGNFVGYDWVEEYMTNGSDVIKTRYSFYNDPEELFDDGGYRAIYSPVDIQYKNGLTKRIEEYSNSTLVKATDYSYQSTYSQEVLAFIDRKQIGTELDALFYKYRVEYPLKNYETVTLKDQNGGQTVTQTAYTYNSKNLIQTSDINVDGYLFKDKYKYPFDFNDAMNVKMVEKNKIGTPVEVLRLKNDRVVSGVKTAYKEVSGLLLPDVVSMIQTTAPLTESTVSSYYKPELYWDIYNSYGKPVQVRKEEMTICYLWGYDSQYPIAEIRNVTYDQLKVIIPEATINAIAAKNEPAAADWTTINNLRSSLPNALVTTYTYKPLVGMVTMTDPRGVVTNYDYDSFGRLQKLRQGGKAKQEYEYNYVR